MALQGQARIAVVTDSAACIPPRFLSQYNIQVIPFQLVWEGQAFRDGVGMCPEEFYRRFRDSAAHPTTSQPTLGDFAEVYSRVGQQMEGIVSIHVPEQLSTTVAAARLAATQASPVPVQVVDARTAAMAQGFVVLAAARAAQLGADLRTVASTAETYARRVGLFATLETLEHLHRGGRIGQAAALLGTRLHLCPILFLARGQVKVAGVPRNRQRAKEQILDLMAARVGSAPIRASVFHADAVSEAQQLAQQVQDRFRCIEFFISEFTPVMGAHTGPGTIGVAYCLEEETPQRVDDVEG